MKELNSGIEGKVQQPLIKLDKVYESLRVAEYCINDGIGEIVDNAVEAKPQSIHIDIENKSVRFDDKKKSINVVEKIVVTDDGTGMDTIVLHKCLVLGETNREIINGNTKGIGRFGVGLTLGGISLARRIEVYSRNNRKEEFKYCYIDLDEIQDGNQIEIAKPIEKKPPKKYGDYLKDSTGTIIILDRCDRLQYDSIKGKGIEYSTHEAGLSYFLGRTYRKFIYGGLNIYLNGNKVFLHDPLYQMGPTKFDTEEALDPRAKSIGEEEIELPIPNSPEGKTGKVKIKMTLLPREWRLEQGDGGRAEAKMRKIPENEGESILRAGREVFYDKIPNILGPKGASGYEERDRFWGCEISFEPELDEYFQVRYIKRGIEPISSLRQKLQEVIGPVVKQLRKEISDEFKNNKAKESKKKGSFRGAEEIMEKTSKTIPQAKKGLDISEEEANKKINDIAKSIVVQGKDAEEVKQQREEKKKLLKENKYTIEPVSYPQNVFFETDYLLGNIIIKLNINHPFYEKIFVPLCGRIDEDNDIEMTLEQQRNRDAILLLILSYAQAEGMFINNNEDLILTNLKTQWGAILATAISNM